MKQAPDFSPHMLMAAKEIEDVLKRYDLAGVAVLQDPTGVKVVQRLDPTGTCSYMKGGAFGVREPEMPRDLEQLPAVAQGEAITERRETIFRTLNMVVNLRIVTTTVMVALQQAEDHVRKFFKLTPPRPGGSKKIIT